MFHDHGMYAYGDVLRTRATFAGAIEGFVVMVLAPARGHHRGGPEWTVMFLRSPISSLDIEAGETRTWLQATLDNCERL